MQNIPDNTTIMDKLIQMEASLSEVHEQMMAVTKEIGTVEASVRRKVEKLLKENCDVFWGRNQEAFAKQEILAREHQHLLVNLISSGSSKDLPAVFRNILEKKLAAVGAAVARDVTPIIEKTVYAVIAESFQEEQLKVIHQMIGGYGDKEMLELIGLLEALGLESMVVLVNKEFISQKFNVETTKHKWSFSYTAKRLKSKLDAKREGKDIGLTEQEQVVIGEGNLMQECLRSQQAENTQGKDFELIEQEQVVIGEGKPSFMQELLRSQQAENTQGKDFGLIAQDVYICYEGEAGSSITGPFLDKDIGPHMEEDILSIEDLGLTMGSHPSSLAELNIDLAVGSSMVRFTNQNILDIGPHMEEYILSVEGLRLIMGLRPSSFLRLIMGSRPSWLAKLNSDLAASSSRVHFIEQNIPDIGQHMEEDIPSDHPSSLAELKSDLAAGSSRMEASLSEVHEQMMAVTKEIGTVEASVRRKVEKLLKENCDAFWGRNQEDFAKQEILAREHQHLLVNLISSGSSKDLPAVFGNILEKKLTAVGAAVARDVTPIIEKTVSAVIAESFQRGVGDKAVNQLEKSVTSKLEATVSRHILSQFQTSGKQAIQEALKISMEATVLPAFDRSCKSMFEQVDATFQKGMIAHSTATQQYYESTHYPLATALREVINTASSLTQTLTTELAEGQRKLMSLAVSSKAANPLITQPSDGPFGALHDKIQAPLDLTT